jgi:hypothetical protein
VALVDRTLPNAAKWAPGTAESATALPVRPICTLQHPGVSAGIREPFGGTIGDVDRLIPEKSYAPMPSKQDQGTRSAIDSAAEWDGQAKRHLRSPTAATSLPAARRRHYLHPPSGGEARIDLDPGVAPKFNSKSEELGPMPDRRNQLRTKVDAWNETNRIGTPVEYRSDNGSVVRTLRARGLKFSAATPPSSG